MFDTKYKEAFEDMKLTNSFKSGLVNMMKKESTKPVPRKRLALAAIAAVILVSTSVVFATNYATKGELFKSVMSSFGYDPQNTTSSLAVVTEATEATEAPTATPTAAATATPTAKPTATATPSVTPTVTPSTTPTAVPGDRIAPTVSAAAGSNSVTVSWTKITSPDLVGYKVVASKSDSTPKYSENGYYKWITDADTTSCTISNGASYNGGDVGTFSGGTKYYFSVTAIYGEEWQTVAGNAISVTMPGAAVTTAPTEPAATTAATATETIPAPTTPSTAPVVSAVQEGDGVRISWTPVSDATGFSYYKIVASVSKASPAYPNDGYATYICDATATNYLVKNGDSYNGGDIGGKFVGGTIYNFSVTTCFGDTRYAGNGVPVTMPGTAPTAPTETTAPAETTAPTDLASRVAPSVNAAAGTGCVTVTWVRIDSPDLIGYKVVASPTVANPVYDANGYYKWITDRNITSCTINTGAGYHDGDVGTFTSGTNYNFSVTAIYGSEWQKIAGNAVPVVMP